MSDVAFTLGSPMLAPIAPGNSSAVADNKTMGALDQELEEWALEQPSVTRCAWCEWTFKGTIAAGQQASHEHRATAHGITGTGRKRMRSRKRNGIVLGDNDLAENIAKTRAAGGGRFHIDADMRQRVRAAAQAATTKEDNVATCKIDGCTNPSAGKGGWCAGLCQQHISEEGSRRQRVRHERARVSEPPAPAAEAAGAPNTAPAQPAEAPPGRLTILAQAVDQAQHDLDQAIAAHGHALQALRDALDSA